MDQAIGVSAVIPTYNGEQYIAGTVKSILGQSRKPDEIIIIDDCSSDNTYEAVNEIVEGYKGYVKPIRLDSNHGPSYCRNHGMKLAAYEWILFMDHDDLADEQLIEKELCQLQKMNRYDNWVLVHPAYKEINKTGEDLGRLHRWKQRQPEEVLGYEFFRNNIITTSGVLLNKQIALEAGGFDSTLKYSQDWDLWLKLAQRGGFVYVDEPLIKVRRHPENTSASIKDFLSDEKRILEKYDLKFIEEAISRRNLPCFRNMGDYGSILVRLEQWEKVISLADELVHKYPGFDTGYFLQGLYWIKKSGLENALDAFSRAMEINPGNFAAVNNYAGILLACGRLKEAESIFRKLVSNRTNYMDANHNLRLAASEEVFSFDEIKFTWRELRQELMTYSS